MHKISPRALLALAIVHCAFFEASCGSDSSGAPTSDAESGICVDGADESCAALGAGWNRISPGGDTICADGSPYSFFVHPGTTNKVLVYFAFGGFCFSTQLCRVGAPNYVPNVDAKIDEQRLESTSGIFDLKRDENPFKSWTLVYVPECTADFEWGNNVQHYDAEAGYPAVTINHKGFINVTAVREWVHKAFPEPDTMFISGSSGGGDAMIMHFPYFRKLYEGTKTRWVSLADASFGVVTEQFTTDYIDNWKAYDNRPSWVPELADLKPEDMTWDALLINASEVYPDAVIAEIGSAKDQLQTLTYGIMGGEEADWPDKVEASVKNISDHADTFRYFLASGSAHVMLDQDAFYYFESDGTLARDWIADLANGNPVSSHHCVGSCTDEQMAPQ